ncbi:hypothetical protein BGZ81_008746, partial [Podila clonocystis]
VAKKLRKARRLEVYGQHLCKFNGNTSTTYVQQWKVIDEVLNELETTDGFKIDALAIHHMVREDRHLQRTLKLLPHLTSLVLVDLSHSQFSLLKVLHHCPQLESVDVFSEYNVRLGEEDSVSESATVEHFRSPLRSLKLAGMYVGETALERSPNLRELHLKYLERHAMYNSHCALLVERCTLEGFLGLCSLFPHVTEWVYTGVNSGIAIPAILTCTANVLTSLDIDSPIFVEPENPALLHNFLCDAPHLLHLKAASSLPLDKLNQEGNLIIRDAYRSKGDPGTARDGPAAKHRTFTPRALNRAGSGLVNVLRPWISYSSARQETLAVLRIRV